MKLADNYQVWLGWLYVGLFWMALGFYEPFIFHELVFTFGGIIFLKQSGNY